MYNTLISSGKLSWRKLEMKLPRSGFSVGGRVLYPNCTTVEGIEKKTNSETNSLAKSLAQTK